MKIEKKNLKSATSRPVEASKYDATRKYIRSAIDELGKIAKDDVTAKSAIADLGVILFDLT